MELIATGQSEAITLGEKAKYLPTVFVFKGESKVSSWPDPQDRVLIPGLALIMQIDSSMASSFKLTTLIIENACKSGKRRSSWPCKSKVIEGVDMPYPEDGQFSAQLEIKVISKIGSVTSSISNGGIINLGNTVNYDQ